MKRLELLAGLVLLLVPGPQDRTWARVGPDLELAFPRDHGAHLEYRTEWWYVTGRVRSSGGRRFGYQLTIFRSGLDPSPPGPGDSPLRARHVLAGHLVLTDVAAGRTLLAERLRRAGSPLVTLREDDLELALEDWSLARGADHRLRLVAGDAGAGFSLDLELRPEKDLVLHGADGYSLKGGEPGNASAYVSWPRLATAGRLRLAGEELAVEGSSWFDHEFGSSVLGEGLVGWDWFGLQLDDGRELMVFLLRREDGAPAAASAGTLVEVDGTTRSLGREDFRVRVEATWTSPHTRATYPARWTLAVPGAGLELEIEPLVPDAELRTEGSTKVSYWEGPVEVRGSTGGGGYAELTGYAGSMRGRL